MIEALAPYAFSVHLKDQALRQDPDGFLLGDIPLGQGGFDLKRMVATLRRAKPDIRMSLELITRDALKVPCLRFVVVPSMSVPSLEGGSGDWDTHTPTAVRGVIPNLALACDQPLAGLIADLKQRGLLDQTLVVWGGEMGRGGNGHMNHNGSAFTWWMAGGGIRGGMAYGATDEQGFTAVEKPIHVRDLHATILWMCGLDHRKLKHNGVGFDDACKVAHEIIG